MIEIKGLHQRGVNSAEGMYGLDSLGYEKARLDLG